MRLRLRRRRRGYLLIEVMVSGILAGTVLTSLMFAIAQMRQSSMKASRDASAAQLVQQRVEELRSVDFDYLDVMRASSPIVEDLTMGGNYERTTTISPKGAAGCREFQVSTSYIDCHNITVTTTYVQHAEIRDVSTTLRIYDPDP